MAPKTQARNFATEPRQLLPGSEKAAFHIPAEAPARGTVTVSVVVRRKTQLNKTRAGIARVSRAEYSRQHAAEKNDLKQIHAFAKEFGLRVHRDTPKPERRTVLLTGTPAAMQKAFGVELKHATLDGGTYRIREGGIHIPASLSGIIVAVLGLDNRPQAKPHFRYLNDEGGVVARAMGTLGFAKPHAAANSGFTPVEVGQLYQFPANAKATGQTIGIIELGGGYRTTDITAYFKSIGVPAPSVTTVSVDGGKNSPSNANSADGEVMLDIEVAAAVAPGAKIVVYFAPNTDQGFFDAVGSAVHDTVNKPSVISISWGGPESKWTQQSMTSLDAACQSAAALGITITVAAGDDGSTDGLTDGKQHCDFPASSPHVLACGGTRLVGSGSSITSEVVWNELSNNEGATGGGVSSFFPLPTWQTGYNVPKAGTFAGRGVPDVGGDADPTTGYVVRVDGKTSVIGGTSAVAPLFAGLIAVSNATNKKPAGFLQPAIYTAKAKSSFRDITQGNNGAYSAATGWDACTGLGSPIGTALIKLLGAAPGATTSAAKPATKKIRVAVKTAAKKAGKKAAKKTPAKKAPAKKTAAKKSLALRQIVRR
jgi:kumamolisin